MAAVVKQLVLVVFVFMFLRLKQRMNNLSGLRLGGGSVVVVSVIILNIFLKCIF